MRLSIKAKKLLDENKVAELQALPFVELIHPSCLEDYKRDCGNPLPAINEYQSATIDLQDAVYIKTIENAVVVSSGQIYSQATMDDLFTAKGTHQCPLTREVLKTSCYNSTEPKASFVKLPQVDRAINYFRAIRDAAKLAKDPSHLFTEYVQIGLKVSGCKLRIEITSKVPGLDLRVAPFFSNAFNHNPDSAMLREAYAGGYSIQNFGCCWLATSQIVRLEFWFPSTNRLTDTEVVRLSDALVAPLALPPMDIPFNVEFGSVADVGIHEYKICIPPIQVLFSDALRCCEWFLNRSNQIALERQIAFTNTIFRGPPPLQKAIQSGFMMFGPRPNVSVASAPPYSTSSSALPVSGAHSSSGLSSNGII